MANEGDPLDISGDVGQHPPVDHPARIHAEQQREAHQTQGGPGAAAHVGPAQAQAQLAKAKGEKPTDQGDPLTTAAGEVAGAEPRVKAAAVKTAVAYGDVVIPPSVLQFLGAHPEYGDNPWMPLPGNILDPVQQWKRAVRVGRVWRSFVNPEGIDVNVRAILDDHSWQGAQKRALLGMGEDPASQWIENNLLPQLLVAAADSNPVTAALDLVAGAPQDPTRAVAQAWQALPWSDYTQMAADLVQGKATDPGLVSSAFWKGLTASLAVAGVVPDFGLAGRLLARVGLGEGRMAIARPWGKHFSDAVAAARKLPVDPDVPPPDRLAELARNIDALRPTVVRPARAAAEAVAAPVARQAPLVDLSRHLERIGTQLTEGGPSQERALELMQRLRLLNIKDPALEAAFEDFRQLHRPDFDNWAAFAAARQERWGRLTEALGKADASRVQQPSALDFLEAADLDTLPTQVLRQLTRLAHEEIADRAVQRTLADQAARYQRKTMHALFRGLFGRDRLRQLLDQGVRPTEELMRQQLPHMLPHMTEGQQAFLRAIWNKFMDYDLRRLHPEDVQPRPLHEYLDELSGEVRQHATRLIGSTYGVLAFIQGGPHMLEDNAIESLVQALFNRNRAHEAMLGEFFFPHLAAVADAGRVDMEQAMRAIRDDAAFQALPTEGRLIVDAWRHVQLLLRDRAMAIGYRSDFVGRFDPRVPVRLAEAAGEEAEKLIPRLRAGRSPLGTSPKGHRIEALQVDPEDPHRVAIGEKYRTVFDLNAAMQDARRNHVASLMGQGADRVAAELAATRRYPTYHTNLAYAMYEYLAPELRALNSHLAVQELLHSFTEDGGRLAYQRTERAAPEGYRTLRSAGGRAFQDVLFHPQFADSIDKANEHISLGSFEGLARFSSGAKAAIMVFPQIHMMNVAGRVLPMLLTHPWAAVDELLGRDADPALQALDPQVRRTYRMMQAMQNGVVPHKGAREFFNDVMSGLGNATGDSRMFEVPTGATAEGASKFIRDRARQMPGLVGRITPAWLQKLNDVLWRGVFAFQVLAYHVEQRALTRRFPDMDPVRVNLYAAFRANRWGGAIEPENWSTFGYHASRLLMFAPNWLRSFLELQAPIYLKGELAASPELRRYVWEQWIRSLTALLAGQQITGNALNLLLSGHTIYQNQPQNRNRIEIDPSDPYSPGRVVYDALKTADPAMVAGIDPSTGVNPMTGAPLTWENPFARQQRQFEEGLDVPYFGDPTMGWPAAPETLAAAHASPLVDALTAALNWNLYGTARNGFMTAEHENPAGWDPSVLLPSLLQLTPAGYSFGGAAAQAAHDTGGEQQYGQTPVAPGQASPGQGQSLALPFMGVAGLALAQDPGWQDQWRAWAQDLPVPAGFRDMIASAPDSALKTVLTNALGVNSPYEKSEVSKGTRLGDVRDAQLQQVLANYHQVMAGKSQDMMTGKMTPYQWRQWYQSYVPNYDGELQAYFQGSPAHTRGLLGLYHSWQQTYAEAELPDHSGIDWGKLEQLQNDFRAHHTDAEMTAIKAYQAQQEHGYPALQMYREVTDDHRAQQRTWARQLGMTDVQLSKMLSDYAQVAGDRHAQGAFYAQHPQMVQYLRLNEAWEIDSPYGRMYSLYYHSSAMRKWLAMSGETEQQGAQQLEGEWRP